MTDQPMNEARAREIIAKLNHFDKLLFDRRFDDPERSTMREYITAKGFLAGLEAGRKEQAEATKKEMK